MEVVLFLPGILGSKLETPAGEEVWPPTPLEALGGYRRIAKLLQSDLRVTGVVEKVCIDVYGSMLTALQRFGYTDAGAHRRLIRYAYDWRRDLASLSDELAQTLAGLVAQYGAGVEIKLVCHSMGGLVARGCLENPGAAALPWAGAVKLAIFLATPHEGAPLAFARAVGVGGSSLGLNETQLRQLAEAAGYPAGYQLLPPAALEPLWQLDHATPFRGKSLFDPAVVANYGLNAGHLAATRAFQARLEPTRRPAACRYFAVVSAAHETITRLDEDMGVAAPVKVKSSGDGTVPIQSAAALRVQTAYVEANHVGVVQKPVSHKIVGILLGAIPAEPVVAGFADGGAAMSLSLSERTIAEDQDYEIVVVSEPTEALAARIRIQRDAGDGRLEEVRTIALDAQAPGLERISLQGPRLARGRYVFDLLAGDAGAPADTEELLVSGTNHD